MMVALKCFPQSPKIFSELKQSVQTLYYGNPLEWRQHYVNRSVTSSMIVYVLGKPGY